jgi:hypothetical protein
MSVGALALRALVKWYRKKEGEMKGEMEWEKRKNGQVGEVGKKPATEEKQEKEEKQNDKEKEKEQVDKKQKEQVEGKDAAAEVR